MTLCAQVIVLYFLPIFFPVPSFFVGIPLPLFSTDIYTKSNQKKILGMVEATADEIAKAKVTAAMASRTNVLLSIPLLLSMTAFAHGNLV